jgi:phosphatidylserine decarboxylase
MRIPLAPAGSREMLILTLLFGAPAIGCMLAARLGYVWFWPAAALLGLLWLGGLAFFRDPERASPAEPGLMVAPADGRVVEITKLDHDPEIGGPATRIAIFLSVFDVHINRSPCAGTVRSVRYKPGKFLDARDPDSGRLNESNTIVVDPAAPHVGPVVVRQIAGLIARRIVCPLQAGDHLGTGQRIGLIKFGSRTELILPGHDLYEPAVRVGDRAVGAVTVMARRTAAAPSTQQTAAMAETKR